MWNPRIASSKRIKAPAASKSPPIALCNPQENRQSRPATHPVQLRRRLANPHHLLRQFTGIPHHRGKQHVLDPLAETGVDPAHHARVEHTHDTPFQKHQIAGVRIRMVKSIPENHIEIHVGPQRANSPKSTPDSFSPFLSDTSIPRNSSITNTLCEQYLSHRPPENALVDCLGNSLRSFPDDAVHKQNPTRAAGCAKEYLAWPPVDRPVVATSASQPTPPTLTGYPDPPDPPFDSIVNHFDHHRLACFKHRPVTWPIDADAIASRSNSKRVIRAPPTRNKPIRQLFHSRRQACWTATSPVRSSTQPRPNPAGC